MKQISIIIEGTRYNAVEADISRDVCATCDLSEMCFNLDCFPDFCDTFLDKKSNFKKAHKKKTYIFSNHYTHKRGNNYYHIEVEAETILEAKKKVKEKYPDDVVFIKIK